MQQYFYDLADELIGSLRGDQVLLLYLEGETSDFVRLNHNAVRQAGHVKQNHLTLTLIRQGKQAAASLELCCQRAQDTAAAKQQLDALAEQIHHLPDDPFIHYATDVNNSEFHQQHPLPSSQEALEQILTLAQGLDLVGIWANGTMYRGFANSLGQKNWHNQNSFNFDWSIYQEADKAVKCGYAGFDWNNDTLNNKIQHAHQAIAILKQPLKTIHPGQYRTYFSPAALCEFLDMMSWGGFGLKSHKAQHTPLIKMVNDDWQLNKAFNLVEHHQNGLTPSFTRHGFIKPEQVNLITQGKFDTCLTNPRSAKEYSAITNCDQEHPESLQLNGGTLQQQEILKQLDTGLYINNLWYCNFSDHNHCRITGMTRFACFWVEDGEIVAPINVMRFDDSIYNIFGKNFVDFTQQQETILDAGSYEQRSCGSYRVPGALVNDFTLTL